MFRMAGIPSIAQDKRASGIATIRPRERINPGTDITKLTNDSAAPSMNIQRLEINTPTPQNTQSSEKE